MPKTKVLICDDEPSLLRLLQLTLETEGYDVILASDGDTALRRAQSEDPEVMLLDVMMPVIDGWGVLERLAALPKRPVVICVTAKSNRRDLVRGWKLGADEYLTKPFSIEQLLRTLEEVIVRTPEQRDERRREAVRELGGT